jgi:AcrR family transcriptional regulator
MSRADSPKFLRARKPAEREVRREAILAAAAALFDAEGAHGTGLNAIAAKAGFTKSNLYRYFESREEVLLALLLEGFTDLTEELVRAYATLAPNDIVGLARLTAAGFASRPRLGQLMAILATILETNLSEDRIVALKRELSSQLARIAAAIHGVLPGASLADCQWAAGIAGTLVTGMWPNLQPGSTAARVMARPEFAALKPTVERDLERAIRALLEHVVRPPQASRFTVSGISPLGA